MVRTEHDYKLYESGGILGQLAFEPQQGYDIANIVVASHQCLHAHFVVGGLVPSVITNG